MRETKCKWYACHTQHGSKKFHRSHKPENIIDLTSRNKCEALDQDLMQQTVKYKTSQTEDLSSTPGHTPSCISDSGSCKKCRELRQLYLHSHQRHAPTCQYSVHTQRTIQYQLINLTKNKFIVSDWAISIVPGKSTGCRISHSVHTHAGQWLHILTPIALRKVFTNTATPDKLVRLLQLHPELK